MEQEPIEDLIVIHPNILRKFMRHGKDFANLIALYSFYLYHAKQQKTNKPLATDEFTRKGMNWAIDRVKRIKKILKEMKLIEVVQYRKYYYVHLFFIYTKKKLDEIFGNNTETEALAPNKPIEEKKLSEVTASASQKGGAKAPLPTVRPVLKQWVDYCDKNKISYGKSNITYWEKKIENRVTIEQQEAIYNAIKKGWKDFYMVSVKASKYHKLLGKSLMMEKDFDTLLDISYRDKKYIYTFKNITIRTIAPPTELFNRYGYTKTEVKTAPMVSQVRDKIMGVIKRF